MMMIRHRRKPIEKWQANSREAETRELMDGWKKTTDRREEERPE
jgi:hypothetical protein